MPTDPDLVLALTTALGSRVETLPELAKLLDRDLESTTALARRLAEFGFLSILGDTVTYRRPDVTVADLTQRSLAGAAQALDSTLAETQQLLGLLPALLEAWDVGDDDEHSIDVDILHGPYAAADIWRLQYSRGIPRISDVMMPDTIPLYTAKPEHQSSFWAARADEPLQVRLLMSTVDATNPAAQERIQSELDVGVQIRMHPNPPSWFWVTDHETAGIPLHWGQSWPTSVMAIRSAPLASLLTWIYERVWEEAVPVGLEGQPWDPILKLMNQGLTMEAATRTLGLSPRTGRRRVADAMEHFGAETPFALGAAWQKSR